MASGKPDATRQGAPPRLSRRAPQATPRDAARIAVSAKKYAPRPGHTRTTPLIANIYNTMMHNNKCCTTSCTSFSPHSGTRCTRAPPRPPRRPAAPPTPRAQPLRTHIHTHNLPHNKHTRTCTFPPPRHVPRNTTARLRAVYRPAPCGYLLGPRSRDDCLPPAYNHRFGAHHYYCRFGAHHYYCRYCRYCSLPQNQPARSRKNRPRRSPRSARCAGATRGRRKRATSRPKVRRTPRTGIASPE